MKTGIFRLPWVVGGILLFSLLQGCAANKHNASQGKDNKNKAEQAKEQEKETEAEDKPEWVRMMDDPNVNYFRAVEAFDRYWKDRREPVEVEHSEEEKEYEKMLKRNGGDSEEEYEDDKEEAELNPYRTSWRRFNAWKREMYPYVQPDGSILTPEKQMEVWKNQRK